MYIALAFLMALVLVGLAIFKTQHNTKLERMKVNGRQKDVPAPRLEEMLAAEAFPVPRFVNYGAIALMIGFIGLGSFQNIFFRAEPGFIYHVRTVTGQERVISGVGYYYHIFGKINDWKREMSVQASTGNGSGLDTMDSEGESENMSAGMPPLKLTMLDQVDAKVQATARFQLPTDEESFLKIAHSYRTPENLLRTSLIPQFKETLKATSSLMGAEEYYSGGRTEFQNEFEQQMMEGIFVVKRIEKSTYVAGRKGSANAAKGTSQDDYDDGSKTVFTVEKVLDENLQPKIKTSKSFELGIVVVEARITDLEPNEEFAARMKLKQKASADRAIAREQRIQEEEQKLLEVAKGQRQIAEKQAASLVKQIEQTTDAETEKQLAITAANRQKESAAIQQERAEILLGTARIDAEAIVVLADAAAYEKKALLEADNALQIKLDALVEMNKAAMDAFAKRQVPTNVIYTGGSDGGSLGANEEIANIAATQMMKNLKQLDLDVNISTTSGGKKK